MTNPDTRDPRERIVDATIQSVVTFGIEGVTHRRVAEIAGVSRSLTTYYFATLDDLIETAMTTALERDVVEVRRRFEAGAVRPEEVPDLLAEYFAAASTTNRDDAILVSELYVASLRRERLRPLAERYNRVWVDMLTPLIGPAADNISTLMGGMTLILMLRDQVLHADHAARIIRSLLASGVLDDAQAHAGDGAT